MNRCPYGSSGVVAVSYTHLASLVGDLDRVAALHDDAADFVGDRHHLVDADPALVTVVALVATGGLEYFQIVQLALAKALIDQLLGGDLDRFLAVLAQPARQPLGDDEGHAGGDVVGRDAHVHQAAEGLRRAVGVEGGQHHVAGLGGLDGDFGGFQIADFADHHHVGVLAENGAQTSGESHFHLGVDLGLADAVQVILCLLYTSRCV